jgi:pimeloyl-[acyl-carrier protein] methyl ester esterase
MSWPRELGLVFLPGLDGTGLSFEPLRPFLPSDIDLTVVRYPADRLLSFDDTVECAADQIPAGEAKVVLAESFSGPVAVRLLSSGRVRAKCLILCCTFVRPPRPLLLQMGKLLPLSYLMRIPVPEFILRRMLGGDDLYELRRPLYDRIRKEVPSEILAHRLRVLSDLDVSPCLRSLSLPCCYIQATEDWIVPPRCLSPFREALSNLYVRHVRGPHTILQARPEECLSIIEEFLHLTMNPLE